MNPYDFQPDNKPSDFKVGDRIEYGIRWRADDSEGFRTGIGEVESVGGGMVRVKVTAKDARYMDLRDRLCLFVPQRLRKPA